MLLQVTALSAVVRLGGLSDPGYPIQSYRLNFTHSVGESTGEEVAETVSVEVAVSDKSWKTGMIVNVPSVLSPSSTFQLTVAAVNEIGEGPASPGVELRTCGLMQRSAEVVPLSESLLPFCFDCLSSGCDGGESCVGHHAGPLCSNCAHVSVPSMNVCSIFSLCW